MNEPFLLQPDDLATPLPTIQMLREYWTCQSAQINQKLQSVQAAWWFEKHTAVSHEDFTHEPHRNKLNILLTRTTHLAYHYGQLNLLKNKINDNN